MNDEQRIGVVVDLAKDFAAAARAGGPACPIPSCPEWTMTELVDHVAMEYGGWYYSNLTIAPGHADPLQEAMAVMPPFPEEFADKVAYIERNADRFAAHAREVDLDADVWIFNSAGPARFWLRQTIMEVAAHTWDAATAVGQPSPLDQEIALEAIDQFCEMQYHRGQWWGEPWTPPDTPFGLVATDAGASWLLREEAGRARYDSGDGEDAPALAAAPAESLYLWTTGRSSPVAVRLEGDPDLIAEWRPNWA